MERSIIHVDMDEFFAAVEKLDNPQLRGKCLLIGGEARARGVVATASYEARQYGCHSAMPMAQAVRLCPQAMVLPVRHKRYSEVSGRIFEVLREFTPLVEPLSIDEAFLDVTGCEALLGPSIQMAKAIKTRIAREIGLTASVGVAPNKFLAKLASDLKKPDGLMVITAGEAQRILDPLPVSRLWGAGPATVKLFERLNAQTIGQVRRLSADLLDRTFGKMGGHFYRLARGIDDRPVVAEGQTKSIGQEETFAADIADMDRLRAVLLGQVGEVARLLREQELLARTVTLKLRQGDFTTQTRSATLAAPSDATEELWQAAQSLLTQWARGEADRLGATPWRLPKVCEPQETHLCKQREGVAPGSACRPLRLLGVTLSGLASRSGRQLGLFEEHSRAKLNRLDKTMDDITDKFGKGSLRRGVAGRGDHGGTQQ
jgi:DNA polymerase-4